MEFSTYTIKRIEIGRFKKIRDFSMDLSEKWNLFYGKSRSGKTSLCEFIRFALYGLDSVSLPKGDLTHIFGKLFLCSENGRELILSRGVENGDESLSFTEGETGQEIPLEKSPGETLTGLDQDDFDFISYFRQARYETPLCQPKDAFLRRYASFDLDAETLYDEYRSLKEKVEKYKNSDKTGFLDALLCEKEELEAKLGERPVIEETAANCERALSEIAVRLDENERRTVILKADMANFADDVKLAENKKNSEDLKKEIHAKEKSFRIHSYEIANKTSKLSRESLGELKEDYNSLSLAITEVNEARNLHSSLEENLAFHQKLFGEKDSLAFYEQAKAKIHESKVRKTLLRALGVIFLALGATAFLFINLRFDLLSSALAACCFAVVGVAFFFLSAIFTSAVRKVLAETGKEDLKAFHEFYEKVAAHAKTTQVYLDQIEESQTDCENKEELCEELQDKISGQIRSLGFSSEDGDLIAICDEIIEGNDFLYDLEDEIEREKDEYMALLRANIQKNALTVSEEFLNLQKELDFLLRQNESLLKKELLIREQLKEARAALSDPEAIRFRVSAIEIETARLEPEFQALFEKFREAESKKEQFENGMKSLLSDKINSKLPFLAKEHVSFFFDQNFELCYQDKDSVLPLNNSGGGIAELGTLSFRISLAELLRTNLFPMIFDDSFSTLDETSLESLLHAMEEACSQILIATSSPEVVRHSGSNATLIEL